MLKTNVPEIQQTNHCPYKRYFHFMDPPPSVNFFYFSFKLFFKLNLFFFIFLGKYDELNVSIVDIKCTRQYGLSN